jgi:predicted acylesterase/phospholipase RssA
MDDVPADVVRGMGADVVLGVDLNRDRISIGKPQNLIDMLMSSLNIMMYQGTRRANRTADIMVAPELAGFAYRDLQRVDELIERGEAAMREQLRELEELLQPRAARWWSRFAGRFRPKGRRRRSGGSRPAPVVPLARP